MRCKQVTLKSVIVCALAVAFVATTLAPALADPPPWAPAHGYRAKDKHKHKKKGRHGRQDLVVAAPTFDIDLGRCNRELLGGLLGGIAGAAAGSQVGSGSGQKVAIAGGTILGFLVGGSIGRSMDQIDQNCVGQALERAEDGQTVVWRNPDAGATYAVEAVRTYQEGGRYCREYTTSGVIGGQEQKLFGIACRQPDGSWAFQN